MLLVLFRHNKTPKVSCLTFGVQVIGFGASPVFNEAIATGTGSSSVQIDVTKEISTGYITAGGAVRVWDIEITYQ